ncbi:hypothetical protein JMJ35_002964 [Cladonia borealis]|uniref:Uncharacterized protein n=1 Tax=Cladonia borealis TaxID=184061 RepID=A0AA39V3D7_9LECA|nr:hypothetical protein JMJ35_002964 [Cladonia borealis]
MKWCGASSGPDPSPSEKGIKSFNSNYTDNYTEEFADVVKRILIFKSYIADRSSFGSMAEAKGNRVKADATGEDVEQIGQVMARSFESMTQQNPDGKLQLRLPATPLDPMIAGTSYQPGSVSDSIEGEYEKETLQMYGKMLDDHVFRQVTIESLLDVPQPGTFSKGGFARLRDWASSGKSGILWVVGPNDNRYPSKMSANVAEMVKLFQPMPVFHFCELPNPRTTQDGKSVEEIGLVSMVYSIIQQLIEYLPPQNYTSKDFSLNRFTSLDGTVSTLNAALELMRDLMSVCLPWVIFIVDGIERLDYGQGQQGCEEFVKTLRQLTTTKPRDGEPQRIYKVLFTTSEKPGALMRTLDVKEILLQDEGSGAFDL